MDVPQFTALLAAIAGVLVAITGLIVQVTRTHQLVNSRMTELLALTRSSGHAEGVADATRSTSPAEVVRPGQTA
jgi:hypothetical protein